MKILATRLLKILVSLGVAVTVLGGIATFGLYFPKTIDVIGVGFLLFAMTGLTWVILFERRS